MGEARFIAPGDSVRLSATFQDDVTSGIFPQVTIYSPTGAQVGQLDLTHVALGRWEATFVVPATPSGVFIAHYAVYTDAGHTTRSALYGADQDLLITDFKPFWNELRSAAGSGVADSYGEAIKILLGVSAKANMRIDQTTYNANGFLEQARIRIFATPAAAAAASVDAADGFDGEIARVDLTGVADLVHLTLPDNVLGLLT